MFCLKIHLINQQQSHSRTLMSTSRKRPRSSSSAPAPAPALPAHPLERVDADLARMVPMEVIHGTNGLPFITQFKQRIQTMAALHSDVPDTGHLAALYAPGSIDGTSTHVNLHMEYRVEAQTKGLESGQSHRYRQGVMEPKNRIASSQWDVMLPEIGRRTELTLSELTNFGRANKQIGHGNAKGYLQDSLVHTSVVMAATTYAEDATGFLAGGLRNAGGAIRAALMGAKYHLKNKNLSEHTSIGPWIRQNIKQLRSGGASAIAQDQAAGRQGQQESAISRAQSFFDEQVRERYAVKKATAPQTWRSRFPDQETYLQHKRDKHQVRMMD
jgi:hypothetical protein